MDPKTTFTFTDKGWERITTQAITVTSLISKRIAGGKKWLEINNQLRLPHRDKCKCCGHVYTEQDEIYLAFTDSGNQHICGVCHETLVKLIPDKKDLPIDL